MVRPVKQTTSSNVNYSYSTSSNSRSTSSKKSMGCRSGSSSSSAATSSFGGGSPTRGSFKNCSFTPPTPLSSIKSSTTLASGDSPHRTTNNSSSSNSNNSYNNNNNIKVNNNNNLHHHHQMHNMRLTAAAIAVAAAGTPIASTVAPDEKNGKEEENHHHQHQRHHHLKEVVLLKKEEEDSNYHHHQLINNHQINKNSNTNNNNSPPNVCGLSRSTDEPVSVVGEHEHTAAFRAANATTPNATTNRRYLARGRYCHDPYSARVITSAPSVEEVDIVQHGANSSNNNFSSASTTTMSTTSSTTNTALVNSSTTLVSMGGTIPSVNNPAQDTGFTLPRYHSTTKMGCNIVTKAANLYDAVLQKEKMTDGNVCLPGSGHGTSQTTSPFSCPSAYFSPLPPAAPAAQSMMSLPPFVSSQQLQQQHHHHSQLEQQQRGIKPSPQRYPFGHSLSASTPPLPMASSSSLGSPFHPTALPSPPVGAAGRAIPCSGVPTQWWYVAVRFKRGVVMYYSDINGVTVGDDVVVEADRGEHMGVVTRVASEAPPTAVPGQVLRLATDDDRQKLAEHRSKERGVTDYTEAMVQRMRLHINVTDAEYQLDGHKLTIYYQHVTRWRQRVDFRQLQRRLHSKFKCRIWMKLIASPPSYGAHSQSASCAQPTALLASSSSQQYPINNDSVTSFEEHQDDPEEMHTSSCSSGVVEDPLAPYSSIVPLPQALRSIAVNPQPARRNRAAPTPCSGQK